MRSSGLSWARRSNPNDETSARDPHIIKVTLPTAHIEQDAARKVYEKEKIP
jgi:hypothetical protein